MSLLSRRGFLASLAAPQRTVLVHEHILVDFAGAATVSRKRYDRDEVYRIALPHLEALKRHGCVRLHECTPNFVGRDPVLLARLQQASGIELWTNTGLYAARNFIFLPDYAHAENARQLARRWVRETREGVEGMTPRFIKIGVDGGPLPPLSRKIVTAAAHASRETGLPVCAHTGDGAAAQEELEIIIGNKVEASKFIWVHAQNERDFAVHEKIARAGAWVEFDGISPQGLDWHLRCVQNLAAKGLLNRVLISHDAGWYHVGEPGGGRFRGFTYLFTDFVPKLDPAQARQLLVENPRVAFG
ncbi:MAG: phosphotriesterase [Bryobacteraceae bacterium]